jgi:hypothetical protein
VAPTAVNLVGRNTIFNLGDEAIKIGLTAMIACPAAAGPLKKIQAVSTKPKAGSTQQKADPLHPASSLLTRDFRLLN